MGKNPISLFLYQRLIFADFVNKAEYVQKVNKYDRDMLDEYVATKNEIKDLKVDLEAGRPLCRIWQGIWRVRNPVWRAL